MATLEQLRRVRRTQELTIEVRPAAGDTFWLCGVVIDRTWCHAGADAHHALEGAAIEVYVPLDMDTLSEGEEG